MLRVRLIFLNLIIPLIFGEKYKLLSWQLTHLLVSADSRVQPERDGTSALCWLTGQRLFTVQNLKGASFSVKASQPAEGMMKFDAFTVRTRPLILLLP
jgi:hypothetical protein